MRRRQLAFVVLPTAGGTGLDFFGAECDDLLDRLVALTVDNFVGERLPMPTGVDVHMPPRKPSFTRDQIVSAGEVVRSWRRKVEPKLQEHPYVLVFSGAEPRTALMSYENFEVLWQRADEASELQLQVELLSRILHTALSGQPLIPLAEVAQKAGITPEELEMAGDVEIESD